MHFGKRAGTYFLTALLLAFTAGSAAETDGGQLTASVIDAGQRIHMESREAEEAAATASTVFDLSALLKNAAYTVEHLPLRRVFRVRPASSELISTPVEGENGVIRNRFDLIYDEETPGKSIPRLLLEYEGGDWQEPVSLELDIPGIGAFTVTGIKTSPRNEEAAAGRIEVPLWGALYTAMKELVLPDQSVTTTYYIPCTLHMVQGQKRFSLCVSSVELSAVLNGFDDAGGFQMDEAALTRAYGIEVRAGESGSGEQNELAADAH